MIVDQGDDPHRVARIARDHILDQGRAHQAADRLAPIGVVVDLAVLIELLKQLTADRDAEPNQGIFHDVTRPSARRILNTAPPNPARLNSTQLNWAGPYVPDEPTALRPILADLGHLDPGPILVRTGDGGL